MDVTWHGHGCFRLRGKNATALTDPYPPSLGTRLPRSDADVVTVSHDHPNHSYLDGVDIFLKEMSVTEATPQGKLVVQYSGSGDSDTKVFLLEPKT
ncbi:MAG: hypothetical protein E6J29_03115 [Chloroflexi bacterium]|nr:MAG: hypothetical protein E6J29_03115 [Chloroflexota bacterium]